MCYGYLKIDYSDEIASQNYGFFAHDEAITIQTILTPYDVNGFGYNLDLDSPTGYHGIVNSKKTLPNEQSNAYTYHDARASYDSTGTTITTSLTEREKYLSESDAQSHEMMIFYNDNIQLSLINSTSTTYNQPAEYKVKLTIVANGTSDSLTTSSAVIVANDIIGDQNQALIYVYSGVDAGATYKQVGSTITYSGSGNDFTVTQTEDEVFHGGMRLYIRSGQTFTYVATVASTTSSAVTVAGGHSLVNGQQLYTDVDKEATYLVSPYHISASYDNSNGAMFIYVNGTRVANSIHSTKNETFNISGVDTYIGISTDNADANTRKQFMGELHELAVIKGTFTKFLSLDTLIPNYRDLLLYYRFEEVDE
jgi:hypothetical protein